MNVDYLKNLGDALRDTVTGSQKQLDELMNNTELTTEQIGQIEKAKKLNLESLSKLKDAKQKIEDDLNSKS